MDNAYVVYLNDRVQTCVDLKIIWGINEDWIRGSDVNDQHVKIPIQSVLYIQEVKD